MSIPDVTPGINAPTPEADIQFDRIDNFGDSLNCYFRLCGGRKLAVSVSPAELLSPRRFATEVLAQESVILPVIADGEWRTLLSSALAAEGIR